MKYEYEHRPVRPPAEDLHPVGDLYVVRDLSQQPAFSQEFLARIDGLLAPTQEILRRLIDLGFQSAARK